MIKQLLLATTLLISTHAFALDVLNPFYTPDQGNLLSKTSVSTAKEKYKNETGYRASYYKNTLQEDLQYGITDKISLIGSVANLWRKDNFTDGNTFVTDNSNIDFTVGALYNFFNKESQVQLQASAVYGQSESWADTGTGAYKFVRGQIKTGYVINTTTPYISGDIELPVAQSDMGHDYNRYFVKAGIYQSIGESFSVDADLRLGYEEEWKQRSLSTDIVVSYNFTEKTALSIYGTLPIKCEQQYDGKAYSKLIGLRLTTEF